MNTKNQPSMRERMEEWSLQAARAGMDGVENIAHKTIYEIEMEMEAFVAKRRRAAEDMDLLAWLAGRYVLTAIHAPRRYPAQPNGVAGRPREMRPEEMKRVFQAMAERRDMNGSD